jgi:glucuronoarabinoxylan endo-1,4-beta-xylanase
LRSTTRSPARGSASRVFASTAAAALYMVTVTPAGAADVVVSPRKAQQRIDGFGASSAWTAQNMQTTRASDPDLAFSPDTGVGLSLLRVRIAPDGSCLETATAQQAQARGAKVWATPWSPRADWKSNGDVNNGGTLLPVHYDDWASTLVGFVLAMRAAGVDIVGVSAQNEPNMKPPVAYESCQYSPAELADFIGNHLAPAFKSADLRTAAGDPVRIIAPEPVGWSDLPAFYSGISASPAALAAVGTYATHEYDGTPSAYPGIGTLWQTETDVPTMLAPGPDPTMATGLWVARSVFKGLVTAQLSAWHYWWLYPRSDDNGGLWDAAGQPTKRLFALGNYAKFVRPGYYRVAATAYPADGVEVSAFAETPASAAPSGKVVIVALNETASAVSQTFRFDGVSANAWAAWVTSDTKDCLTEADPPTFDPSQVSYALAPKSVTTLRGTITGFGEVLDAAAGNTAIAAPPSESPSRPGSGLSCSAARRADRTETWNPAVFAGLAIALVARRRRSRGAETRSRRRAIDVAPAGPARVLDVRAAAT